MKKSLLLPAHVRTLNSFPKVRIVPQKTKGGRPPFAVGTLHRTDLHQFPRGSLIPRRALGTDHHFGVPDFTDKLRPVHDGSTNRPFTYFMVGAAGVLSAMGAKSTVMNLLTTLSASGDVLAMAQVEVDLANIPEGKSVVIKWRGKPIFIRHRTPDEVEAAAKVDVSELRDPEPDSARVQKPEWIVMMGICTHLGCVPLADAGDYGGCGSHYDVSGRVRKGPAPLNLEIPKYKFTDESRIVIG